MMHNSLFCRASKTIPTSFCRERNNTFEKAGTINYIEGPSGIICHMVGRTLRFKNAKYTFIGYKTILKSPHRLGISWSGLFNICQIWIKYCLIYSDSNVGNIFWDTPSIISFNFDGQVMIYLVLKDNQGKASKSNNLLWCKNHNCKA